MADLVTLTDVKTHLNITDTNSDVELSGFISDANDVVGNLAVAVLPTEYTEWYDGGLPQILLRHYPVESVTSVQEYTPTVAALAAEPPDTTTTFTSLGYVLEPDLGRLTRTTGGLPWRFRGRVKVVYTAGQTTVPAAVRMAALECVRLLWTKTQGMGSAEYPVSLSSIDLTYLANLLGDYRRAPAIA